MPITLAITPGEPAGIGPDLCIQLAHLLPDDIRPVLLADPQLLSERAALLQLPLQLTEYHGGERARGCVEVLPVPLQAACNPGKPDTRNAACVLAALERAATGCMAGEFAALVTGPVQKSIIVEAGFDFTGHTEFLAAQSGTKRVVMMLATQGLRVALATTHLPLARVPGAITRELLEEVLQILQRDLRDRFGLDSPRILVCGLNPHAGENGHLGREEIDIITPVIEQLQGKGMRVTGPLPADTLFTPRHLQQADAVLAMYHDQGLPVVKALGFGEAVNITLGLPFIRTSVDHGTALDLAGTGKADPGSLKAAIDMATQLVRKGTPR